MLPKTELLKILNDIGSVTAVADLVGADRANVHGWLKRYGIKRQIVFK